MNRRSLILSALAPLAIAVGVSACTVPPPVKPALIPPARVVAPLPRCSADPHAVVTVIEGYPLTCDIVPPQRLDERMDPSTGAYGATWQARCLNYGGTVDTTSGAVLMCRGVDY